MMHTIPMGLNTALEWTIMPVLLTISITACAERDAAEAPLTDTLAAESERPTQDSTGPSVYEVLEEDDRFSRFVTAVDSAGLMPTLAGPGPFTVFVRGDSAFDAMEGTSLNDLLLPENRHDLRALLLFHMSTGEKTAENMLAGATIRTLEGSDLNVDGSDDPLKVGDATMIEANIDAGNGVIHVIDKVLRP